MRRFFSAIIIAAILTPFLLPAPTQPAERTETFSAVIHTSSWDGWAKDDRSVPGWGNRPPEPGTVTVMSADNGGPRTFSGHVEGLASVIGAEVGVVSLSYIYWTKDDTYHWMPLADDGTFLITEEKYPHENKAVVVRAPGHPWTFLSYIFKENEGGKDITLHAGAGKAVRVSVEADGKRSDNFSAEMFELNKSWIHVNNPIGYQWASRVRTPVNSNGSLTLFLPLHPIALMMSADGAANDWQIVDARQAEHFHFVLLPAARFNLTVSKDGAAASGVDALICNDNAALSLHGGKTDDSGHWSAGGLPAGKWWITIDRKTFQFNLVPGRTLGATYVTDSGEFSIGG